MLLNQSPTRLIRPSPAPVFFELFQLSLGWQSSPLPRQVNADFVGLQGLFDHGVGRLNQLFYLPDIPR
jgi:hypothetical protein